MPKSLTGLLAGSLRGLRGVGKVATGPTATGATPLPEAFIDQKDPVIWPTKPRLAAGLLKSFT